MLPCCGHRWSSLNEVDFPIQWGTIREPEKRFEITSIEQYATALADEFGMTSPDVRLFYADESVKEFFNERIEKYLNEKKEQKEAATAKRRAKKEAKNKGAGK